MTAMIEEKAPDKRTGKKQGARDSSFMEPVEYDPAHRGWQLLAMCEGADPELFYAYESLIKQRQAKRICMMCPVMEECLAAVMAEEAKMASTPWANLRFRFGIRGGLNAGERWDLVYPELAAERKRREAEARKHKSTPESRARQARKRARKGREVPSA